MFISITSAEYKLLVLSLLLTKIILKLEHCRPSVFCSVKVLYMINLTTYRIITFCFVTISYLNQGVFY